MTRTLVWHPGARLDLLELHDWISERADEPTATNYTRAVGAKAAKLIELPFGGSPRPELGSGIRSLSYTGRTVILHRITGTSVEILRIAHRGRDPQRMFPKR